MQIKKNIFLSTKKNIFITEKNNIFLATKMEKILAFFERVDEQLSSVSSPVLSVAHVPDAKGVLPYLHALRCNPHKIRVRKANYQLHALWLLQDGLYSTTLSWPTPYVSIPSYEHERNKVAVTKAGHLVFINDRGRESTLCKKNLMYVPDMKAGSLEFMYSFYGACVAADNNGYIWMWKYGELRCYTDNGRLIRVYNAVPYSIHNIGFLSDGRIVLSGGENPLGTSAPPNKILSAIVSDVK